MKSTISCNFHHVNMMKNTLQNINRNLLSLNLEKKKIEKCQHRVTISTILAGNEHETPNTHYSLN